MSTKLRIIETPDYILGVSDEEIKEGERDFFIIANDRDKIWINHLERVIDCEIDPKHGKVLILSSGFIYADEGCKIIAYQPRKNAPELDLPLLPEIVVEDDVEKINKVAMNKWVGNLSKMKFSPEEIDKITEEHSFYYLEGYKAATKVYSEEDLRKAFQAGDTYRYHENGGFRSIPSDVLDEDEFIQSLKQSKTPKWFIAEMEDRETLARASGFSLKTDPVLKTIIIKGETYLVGTYE
jgi:hypothetical protein